MSVYQIKFIKDLVNSSGHNFHCCQEAIEIRAAKSRDRAVEAVKHRFARHRHIPHWTVHAGLIEVEEMASAP